MLHQPSAFDETVFIGLGSNMGDRHQHLERAVNHLSCEKTIHLVACSSFLETAPWGKTNQAAFVNGAVEIRTSMSPVELLDFLKKTERFLGRTPSEHWGPRVIDLDILLFGKRIIKDTQLIIPHRELHNRRFVLDPLIQLDPSLRHPESRLVLRDIIAQLQ